MLVECKNCSNSFNKRPYEIKKSPNHFCTHSCSASFNNKGKTKNKPKQRYCKRCNSPYFCSKKHRSVLCHDCVKKYLNHTNMLKSLTLREFHMRDSVANKHRSWRNSEVRNLNRSWNKSLLQHSCQHCNYNIHVELCHIKSITSFSEDTPVGVVNCSDNILVLCRNCHWELDHGHLDLQNIPGRQASH